MADDPHWTTYDPRLHGVLPAGVDRARHVGVRARRWPDGRIEIRIGVHLFTRTRGPLADLVGPIDDLLAEMAQRWHTLTRPPSPSDLAYGPYYPTPGRQHTPELRNLVEAAERWPGGQTTLRQSTSMPNLSHLRLGRRTPRRTLYSAFENRGESRQSPVSSSASGQSTSADLPSSTLSSRERSEGGSRQSSRGSDRRNPRSSTAFTSSGLDRGQRLSR